MPPYFCVCVYARTCVCVCECVSAYVIVYPFYKSEIRDEQKTVRKLILINLI